MPNHSQKKEDLKRKAITSGGWGFLEKGVVFIIQFVIGIVLARLLPPSDFGLIGLAMIVVGLGQTFVNLGLGPSLIQKQDITQRHVRVVFTTSGIAGLILGIIVYLGAPLTEVILANENVTPIVQALSIIFLIGGLQIPSQALLKKELNFRQIFFISITKSALYGFVTIALAIKGFGVWSLVIGNILQSLISLIGCYWYVQHSLKPLFKLQELKDLAYFGSGMTLSGLFNYFATRGDYFMVGRILGTEALGLYTKAYGLMKQPTKQLVSVISNVLFPAASKMQDDPDRLTRIFHKTMRTIGFVVIPISIVMVILAPEIVIGLYGSNWVDAVAPLQVLAIFGMFRAMYNAAAVFLKAKGWIYRLLLSQIVYGCSIIFLVWIGSMYFGLNGASWAVGFSILIMWLCMMELNCRALFINRVEIFINLIPGIVIGFFTGVTLLLIKSLLAQYIPSYLIRLIVLSLASLLIYIFIILFLPQKILFNLPIEFLEITKTYLPNQFKEKFNKVKMILK